MHALPGNRWPCSRPASDRRRILRSEKWMFGVDQQVDVSGIRTQARVRIVFVASFSESLENIAVCDP